MRRGYMRRGFIGTLEINFTNARSIMTSKDLGVFSKPDNVFDAQFCAVLPC